MRMMSLLLLVTLVRVIGQSDALRDDGDTAAGDDDEKDDGFDYERMKKRIRKRSD